MFFGIGSVISSIIMGYIIDMTSPKSAIIYNLICVVFTIIMAVNSIWYNNYNFSIFSIFVWGILNGAIKTHCLEMLSNEFETKHDPFSIFTFLQGLACGLFQIIQALINDDNAD